MKVQQFEKDKTYVYECDSEGRIRWSLGIHAPDPPESKDPASQEELEWIAGKIVEVLDGKDFNSFGCYCDLLPGEELEGCVIDDGLRCGDVERKEDCKYWRRK